MANGIIPATAGDRCDNWLFIDDFSPGIYDNTFIAGEDPQLPAPIGAAEVETTWCCASLAQGGLGPLPSLSQTFTYTEGFPGALSEWFITGFIMNPGLNVDGPEAIIILEGDDGTTHYVLAYSTIPLTGSSNVILTSDSGTTGGGIFGAPYPAWTRMTVDPATTNPPPVLVFPGAVSTDSAGVSGHLYVYPPILAPTTFNVQDLIVAHSSTTGQVVAYGERVQVLSGIDYPWPSGGGINTNENINYTDPPLSSAYGDQMTLLGAETPWGYGAWGSISVGELLLVKKYGGAVIMYGDIASPSSVISVPGVQPTGDFVGRANATSSGLIYCAQNEGAWIWNGNNTSQKISQQLRDNFYDVSTNVIGSNNYGFYVQSWQDWVLFSGNKMYVPHTNSWWGLYPRTNQGSGSVPGRDLFWFSPGSDANTMYAAPLDFGPNGVWYVKFDSTVPAPHWQWTSLPNKVVQSRSHVVDVVQVMVTLSSPDGTSPTATVQVGGWTSPTLGSIGTSPTTFRLDAGTGSLGLQNISITVNGDNASGSAPILHQIAVGYKARAPQPAGN
jgi:hypothetical protein